jgi:hypothetical protein
MFFGKGRKIEANHLGLYLVYYLSGGAGLHIINLIDSKISISALNPNIIILALIYRPSMV